MPVQFCFFGFDGSVMFVWKAALGVPEDGIMTAELLGRLYLEVRKKDAGSTTQDKQSTPVLQKVCCWYQMHFLFLPYCRAWESAPMFETLSLTCCPKSKFPSIMHVPTKININQQKTW